MVLSILVLIGPVYYLVSHGISELLSLNEYKYMSAERYYRSHCPNNTNMGLQLKCNLINLKCHNYYIEELQMVNECEKIKTKMPNYLSVNTMPCLHVKSYNLEYCLMKYDNDSKYSNIIFIKNSFDNFNKIIFTIYLVLFFVVIKIISNS